MRLISGVWRFLSDILFSTTTRWRWGTFGLWPSQYYIIKILTIHRLVFVGNWIDEPLKGPRVNKGISTHSMSSRYRFVPYGLFLIQISLTLPLLSLLSFVIVSTSGQILMKLTGDGPKKNPLYLGADWSL